MKEKKTTVPLTGRQMEILRGLVDRGREKAERRRGKAVTREEKAHYILLIEDLEELSSMFWQLPAVFYEPTDE